MTVQVEGRIISDWGDFLVGECSSLLTVYRVVWLDLSGVTYVDTRGLEALRRLPFGRLEIIQCPPLIRDLLDRDGSS